MTKTIIPVSGTTTYDEIVKLSGTLDVMLYVFEDEAKDRWTVFGAGYRTGNQDEIDVKNDVIDNAEADFGFKYTGNDIHITSVSQWVPTHVAPTNLLEQVLFGISEDLLRKEA